MAEAGANPDLVELARRSWEAGNRRDIEAIMALYTKETVWDLSDAGMGIFDGAEAVRAFIEEWWGAFEEHYAEVQEILDLGHGVVFARVREVGRPLGSNGEVEQLRGWVLLGERGRLTHVTPYLDTDEARAAAERVAQERG